MRMNTKRIFALVEMFILTHSVVEREKKNSRESPSGSARIVYTKRKSWKQDKHDN